MLKARTGSPTYTRAPGLAGRSVACLLHEIIPSRRHRVLRRKGASLPERVLRLPSVLLRPCLALRFVEPRIVSRRASLVVHVGCDNFNYRPTESVRACSIMLYFCARIARLPLQKTRFERPHDLEVPPRFAQQGSSSELGAIAAEDRGHARSVHVNASTRTTQTARTASSKRKCEKNVV